MKVMKLGILEIIGMSVLVLAPISGRGSETPPTTRQQTIRPFALPTNTPPVSPSQVSLYGVYGYSAWQLGPGEDEGRLFLTPDEQTDATNAAQLMSFFSLSDVHITDKESPVQLPYFGWSRPFHGGAPYISVYSPIILSTTHVLNAAVKTINGLHQEDPFDFGMVLGDVANGTQYNELRWFLDVMDGRYIAPSSGAHLGADTIDYQRPYQAAGLDRSIPWYQVIGNHDQFWMGGAYASDNVRNAAVGNTVLNMGANFTASNSTEITGVYVGVVDGTTPYGNVIKAGPQGNFLTPPTVAPDANRRILTATNFAVTNYMSEFFNTASFPVGHGFTQSNLDSNSACYAFEPMANVPLKVIVLDDMIKTNIPSLGIYGAYGSIDLARYAWLTNELQMGQDSNQLMVLACHVPLNPQATLFNTNSVSQFLGPSMTYQTDAQLIATLHQYSNLILLMAGHRHMNVVTPQPSPDPAHPEYGFWEVETPSLREFPQQFRAWKILRNSDNTLSILTTDVDPMVEPGSPADKSRGYAIGAFRIFGVGPLDDTSSHAFNAELVKTLSPAMQAVIANCGSPLPAPLVLTNTPGGTVNPDWASTSYRVPGSNYTVTAVASPGYSFTGWTGGISDPNPSLTFVMQPGLVLQANFVPTPFVPTNGTFNGLFYANTGVTHQNSGFITVTTTASRNYSGKLQIGGGTYSISGQLDLAGMATNIIARPHQSSLTVQLATRGSELMFGTVSSENSWAAEIIADRAVYNPQTHPAPQTGQYTLLVAGTNGDSTLPEGSGYGTVTVSQSGSVSFAVSLADGTKLSHSAPLSQNGQVPFYASLYKGQGSILGWIIFTDDAVLTGNLSWTKPLMIAARYPSSFAWTTEATGARYYPPGKGSNVLGAASSSVTITLGGGGLGSNITNVFTLDANNHVKNPSLADKLTLSFKPSNGLFQGTQIIPGTRKAASFGGTFLQGQSSGAGCFLGLDQSGRVSFEVTK